MFTRVAALLLTGAVGCGPASDGAAPEARFPNPEPVLARQAANAPGIACAQGFRYDAVGGCVQGAPAAKVPVRVAYRHDMSAFRLIGAAFALDGQMVFDTSDSKLLDRERFAVFTTAVDPGEHEIGVTLVHAGTGHGVFAYLKGYRFEVRSTHALTATRGGSATITIVGYERGGPTAPLEERPAVRLDAK